MSYGFFAAGAAGNVLIDENNPVLRRACSGKIIVTQADTRGLAGRAYNPCFAYCDVKYPVVIGSKSPPLVFAVPAGVTDSGGLAAFMPLGKSGAWTGFRVVYKSALPGSPTNPVYKGLDTKWKYHACLHEPEPFTPGVGYGMRVFNENGRIVFDSNWDIVPFRGLMTNWVKEASSNIIPYYRDWGNERYNRAVDIDLVRQFYSHSWVANDGNQGILISSLSGWEIRGDNGLTSSVRYVIPPTIAFKGTGRMNIYCLVDAGLLQHPTIDSQAMSRFSLLTADTSKL